MLQVLVVISQKFCCRKEAWAMQKLFIKKIKEELRKNGQVSEILKQWVLRCPAKKNKWMMNKIAPALSKCFQDPNERFVFKEHSRIRLATIFIPTIFHTHAHIDLIVWLNSLWIHCLTLQYMYCKYALCFFHSYELHINLSCRKRKA